jgi:hypothetical protein
MSVPPTQSFTPADPTPLTTYYRQPVMAPSNGVALTAMIFGIVGAVVGIWAVVPITGYFSASIAFPLSLTAVICGHIGASRAQRLRGVGRAQALTAVILGYASIAVTFVASAVWTVLLFVGA